jgi:glycosyltransferase involved in cell wall biosynthesis
MKVAVYTISLNEAKFIERWAKSAADADHLFVLDTGSTDNSLDILRKLKIPHKQAIIRPWRFDIARNTALSLLPEDIDYCISLDMDEVLVPKWREHLEQAHKQGLTRPRYQYTWSWQDKDETIPGLQYGGDKIHTRFGYRWKHPVHEVIVPDRITQTSGWIGLEIEHHPDHEKSRGQYLPLLQLAVQEDPSDDRNAFYYARELFFHKNVEEAKAEFIRHLTLPRAVWKPERAASMRYIAKCSSGVEREFWLKKAVDEAPERREALVDLAEFYYEEKSWQDCLDTCQRVLAITEKPLEYLIEARSWGWLPYDYAAISAFYLHNPKLAREYGKLALELDPDNERLQKNMEFYEG